MKLIKQIYDLVNLATNKGITGYHSDTQIMDVIDSVQMNLWREFIKEYPKDKRVRNYLLPFEKIDSIIMTAGVGDIPADFEHEIEATVTVSSVKYPVWIKEAGFFHRRVLDPVDPPTTTNPFARIYSDTGRKIQVSPHSTPVSLSYWRKPVKPIFATTLVVGQPTYDDAGSTDVEWSVGLHDLIVEMSLRPFGVNMRDQQVQQAGLPGLEPKAATL